MRLKDIQHLVKLIKKAESYEEIKIMLDLNGIDLYTDGIVRRVRTHVKNKAFFNDFRKDIYDNIEKIYPKNELLNMIMERITKNKTDSYYGYSVIPEFDQFILGIIIEKYDIKLVPKSVTI